MGEARGSFHLVRFGPYEADVAAGQLRKHGLRIRLQDQPFAILAVFLEHPGEVVTREQLRQRLWPEGTFVDFDNSLNAAINKLREALGDSADNPRYVETLPRRGYRFIAPASRDAASAPHVPVGQTSQSAAAPLQQRIEPAVAPHIAPTALPAAPPAPARFAFQNRAPLALAAAAFLIVALVAWSGLKRLGPRAAASGKAMLVVLPFQNLSGDPAQEYFSDGLTEELTAQISRLQPDRLGVIARSTAMQYRRSPKSIDEIAREMGIQYAVEGSVRRDGQRLRITAQLIEARDQTHVWTATYERDVKDVLSIQQDVAGQVARALATHLLPAGSRVVARASTSSPEAFEAYVQGRFFWSKRSAEGVQKSIQMFQEAIQHDPNYALAYVGLADSYIIWGGRLAGVRPEEAYTRARAAVKKALALDSSLAEAHIAYSCIAFDHDWNFAESEKALKRGLELNPAYPYGHQWHAEYLAAMGRYEEALQAIDRSLALEPFSLSGNLVRGQTLMYLHRYDEAIGQFKKLAEIDSSFTAAHAALARVYRLQNKPDAWFASYYKWMQLIDLGQPGLDQFTATFKKGGMSAVLRARIAILTRRSDSIYGAAYAIARMYASMGEQEKALEWLERAAKDRDDFATHITVDPEFDAFRNDPRFRQLLKRIGFPETK